jgi:UDP-N-acetylmuramoylalanine--D-glutamate ligase
VAPDHLDRHGDLETYTDVKYRIAENMGAGDSVVLNADCPIARRLPVPPGARAIFFSAQQFLPEGVFCENEALAYRLDGEEGEIVALRDLRIPGRHNQANAAAAAAMALAFGVSPERIGAALRSFEGVPHRIESLGTRQGRRVYNDSKATNVGAMQVALEAVDGPIVLLVGGRLKGDDPHSVDDLITAKVRAIVAYGEGREHFRQAWTGLKSVAVVADLKEATRRAFELSEPGDAILLSPACASFDQFDNFEQRGDRFREYVEDATS